MIPVLILALAIAAPTKSSDVDHAIAVIREVGPNGKGGAEAAQAWKRLADADVANLPAILAGMDGASPLARNWLRSAVDPVLERAARDQKPVPYSELEGFLNDIRHDSSARRLAYELIVKNDAKAPDRFLPKFLDDPSPDLRRDAVARLLTDAAALAKAGQKDQAKAEYRKALAAARDFAQLNQLIKALGELGDKVSLAEHAGFLRSWRALGPFTNAENKGLDIAHAPESKLDFGAELDGMNGKIRWKDYTSTKDNGVIDLNEAVGDFPEAVCYVATEFRSKEARDAEIRLGSFIGFKLWVNGELVMVRGDAYTGMKHDHYAARVKLKAGVNTILVKFSQEPPPPQLPKPNHWRFLLRVCDASGAAIKSEG